MDKKPAYASVLYPIRAMIYSAKLTTCHQKFAVYNGTVFLVERFLHKWHVTIFFEEGPQFSKRHLTAKDAIRWAVWEIARKEFPDVRRGEFPELATPWDKALERVTLEDWKAAGERCKIERRIDGGTRADNAKHNGPNRSN